jgi:hypothetical protein
LEHHDEYDTKPSQSKGLTPDEVREYRDRLYAQSEAKREVLNDITPAEAVKISPLSSTSEYETLRKRFPRDLDFTSAPWRYPLWQVANEPEFFAYKAINRADGICLVERIDLPDGRIVIVCIETAGNPGRSITNSVEELCFQIGERFEIPADQVVWLQHYDYDEENTWHMVSFKQIPPKGPFTNPEWIEMTPELWRSLRLKPKKKLTRWRGHFRSKVTKLFHWPTEALL